MPYPKHHNKPHHNSGRKNHKHKGNGRNRGDQGNHNYWKKHLPPKPVHDWEFRITLHRRDAHRRRNRALRIDSNVESLSWDDKLIQTANFTIDMPDPEAPINVNTGDKIKVEVSANGHHYRELYTLRITQVAISAVSSQITVEAADELSWLRRSKDDFIYKKGKKGKHKKNNGWRCDQIAKDVARRYGIGIGKIAKGHSQIDNLTLRGASPLKVIQQAYSNERDNTGRRFVIQLKKGKLHITPLRRSRDLLILAGMTLETTLTNTIRGNFATELEVTGSLKRAKGKHAKIDVVVSARKSVVKRFGFVHNQWSLSDPVSSETAAKRMARRRLARFAAPKQDATVTIPGDPTIRRGDAIRLKLPRYLDEIVYVKQASHTVNGGDYSTDLTMSFTDPFDNKKDETLRKKICQKAKKKHHRPPKFCRNHHYDPYAPPARRNRRDHHHHHGRLDGARAAAPSIITGSPSGPPPPLDHGITDEGLDDLLREDDIVIEEEF